MTKFFTILGIIVGVLAIIAICWWITTFLIFWAWNLTLPALFHLPHITFLEAFGLNILLWIVGSFFRAQVTWKK